MTKTFDYPTLTALLLRIGYDDDAASYHGSLCGALCRQKPEDVDPVQLLDEELETPDALSIRELQAFRDETIASLTDLQSAFMPLLPDDEILLADRARALGAWCEGFLYGLAGQIKLNLRDCSEEVREIVKDFTQFTRASLDTGDNDDVEEDAYIELVEYIRVGAQLIYMELHPRTGATNNSKTMH
ncbi:MAG: UPF0149 family protein [Nevskia sp.]|jgi:uncharacterized protein|nr:UPF0149 family protein [Nevskia sp.]MCK9384163.1 UPF0149 family protein [Nevskia sp.]